MKTIPAVSVLVSLIVAGLAFIVWAADNPTPWNDAPKGHCYGKGC